MIINKIQSRKFVNKIAPNSLSKHKNVKYIKLDNFRFNSIKIVQFPMKIKLKLRNLNFLNRGILICLVLNSHCELEIK